jgi:hypothetical protein
LTVAVSAECGFWGDSERGFTAGIWGSSFKIIVKAGLVLMENVFTAQSENSVLSGRSAISEFCETAGPISDPLLAMSRNDRVQQVHPGRFKTGNNLARTFSRKICLPAIVLEPTWTFLNAMAGQISTQTCRDCKE